MNKTILTQINVFLLTNVTLITTQSLLNVAYCPLPVSQSCCTKGLTGRLLECNGEYHPKYLRL